MKMAARLNKKVAIRHRTKEVNSPHTALGSRVWLPNTHHLLVTKAKSTAAAQAMDWAGTGSIWAR